MPRAFAPSSAVPCPSRTWWTYGVSKSCPSFPCRRHWPLVAAPTILSSHAPMCQVDNVPRRRRPGCPRAASALRVLRAGAFPPRAESLCPLPVCLDAYAGRAARGHRLSCHIAERHRFPLFGRAGKLIRQLHQQRRSKRYCDPKSKATNDAKILPWFSVAVFGWMPPRAELRRGGQKQAVHQAHWALCGRGQGLAHMARAFLWTQPSLPWAS